VATRFYLPSTGIPAVTPAISPTWATTCSGGLFRAPMATTKTGSAQVQVTAGSFASNVSSVCCQQFISPNLAAQTITGTFRGTVFGSKTGGDNIVISAIIRVMDASGTTTRGTLMTLASDANGFKTFIASGSLYAGSSLPVTSVTAQAGDIIVLETGEYLIGNGTSTSDTWYAGDGNATDYETWGEEPIGKNIWAEFSFNLTFGPPVILNANTLMMKGHGN